MVALIHNVPNISKVITYHEKKVLEGVAECLLAQNLPMDAKSLGVNRRSQLMRGSCSLNSKIKVPCLHVAIGLHPLDAKIGSDGYTKLAKKFMSKFGYGSQPYLVYEHRDTYHPHMHIVASRINQNSRRLTIFTVMNYWIFSEIRRLEKEMGLVPVTERITEKINSPEHLMTKEYEHTPLTDRVRNVASYLSSKYTYTELEEWNALLGLYGLRATRCLGGYNGSKDRLYYRNIDPRIKSRTGLSGVKLFGAKHAAARLPTVDSELAEPVRTRIRMLLQLAHAETRSNIDLKLLRSNALELILDQKNSKITIIDHQSLHAVDQAKLDLDDLIWKKLTKSLHQEKNQIQQEQGQRTDNIISIQNSINRSV